MTAQLGSTTDPKALIPGEPSAVESDADDLDRHASTLADVAADLAAVRTPSWSGSASEAFHEGFDPEAENWNQARDSFATAGSNVRRYAGDLRSAQREAEDAIRLWARGDIKTATARTAFTEALAQLDNSGARQMVGPFFDPGQALRNQAEQVLADARNQLAADAARLKDALTRESGVEEDAPSWLAAAAASYGDNNEKLLRGKEIYDREIGDYDDTDKGPSAKATLAELGISVEANLFEAGAEGTTKLGDLTLHGSTQVSVGAEGDASLSITSDGLEASVEVSAGVTVNADGSVTLGELTANAGVEGTAGARAEGTLNIGPDGAELTVESIAGVTAEGEASVEVSGVEAGGSVTGAAGVGFEGDFGASVEDGKITIDGKVTAILGLGGGFGYEFTVDPGEVKDDVTGFFEEQKDNFLDGWSFMSMPRY